MSPAPVSTDQRITALRSTLEQTRSNLAELDADVTRKTLDASTTLEGATAEAWSRGSRQLATLWEAQLALDTVLEEIVAVRGTRPSIPRNAIGRLHALLDGTPVVVSRSGPASATRALTDAPAPTEQLSIENALARMSADYEAVVSLIDAVGAVWAGTLSELEALGATIASVEALADNHGMHRPNQLGLARRALDGYVRQGRRDPLSLPTETVASFRDQVDQAARPVVEAADAVRAIDADLHTAQEALDRCRQALEQVRAEHTRPSLKVDVPAAALVDWEHARSELLGLQGELDSARRMAATRPVDARRSAGGLIPAIASIERTLEGLASIETTGIASRDELRGRLAALRAKAQAMGRGEDPGLDRIYDEATDALYAAPCDLRRAEELVGRFQDLLRTARTGGE